MALRWPWAGGKGASCDSNIGAENGEKAGYKDKEGEGG